MIARPIYKSELLDNEPVHELLSVNENALLFLEQFPHHIYWELLSRNPNAVYLLQENISKIVWREFCENESPDILPILAKNVDKIKWEYLSANPVAVPILEENLDKVVWRQLCKNPNAIHIIEQHPDKINWIALSTNTNAAPILEKNLHIINQLGVWNRFDVWVNMSSNPGCLSILKKNLQDIYFDGLCRNKNPEAFDFLMIYRDEIEWPILSATISAHEGPEFAEFLENNPNKINWYVLSSNPSPHAIRLLKNNKDCIEYTELALNTGARDLIQEEYPILKKRWRNSEMHRLWKIFIQNLCMNESAIDILFEYDYLQMMQNNRSFAEELAQVVFHPERVEKMAKEAGIDIIDYLEIFG